MVGTRLALLVQKLKRQIWQAMKTMRRRAQRTGYRVKNPYLCMRKRDEKTVESLLHRQVAGAY